MTNLSHDLGFLNLDVRVEREIAVPPGAYNPRRRQYRADALLDQVRATGCGHALGITDLDIYAGNLNFVFGLAEAPNRAALISLHRLHAGAGDQTFRNRAVKEAVHELGHTLGLEHCPDATCVMHFSNSLADTDRKDKDFCIRCRSRLPPEFE